ncbi:unnamed protein product [Protopolystoma xenopodis]|uniref:Uncharacterized protein n=1 Tax=Protopolystoma xenopodis TaxID=117903 RepID=A0A3S5ARK8_9PLAT|nr:unnamed protein product [Protopolystoma xenopodis]
MLDVSQLFGVHILLTSNSTSTALNTEPCDWHEYRRCKVYWSQEWLHSTQLNISICIAQLSQTFAMDNAGQLQSGGGFLSVHRASKSCNLPAQEEVDSRGG